MTKRSRVWILPSLFISSLRILELSNNQLSTIKQEQLKTIWFLKLSNNNLDGNNFWGQISDFSFYGMFLDLSNNQFSGKLPRWSVNSTQLEAIDLSKNHFKGLIPRDFCKLDQLLYCDLSKNNLSGYIPSCFSSPSLIHVHLSKNRLSGPLTYGFYNSSFLVMMDL